MIDIYFEAELEHGAWLRIGHLKEELGIAMDEADWDQRFLSYWACMQAVKRQKRVRVVVPGGIIIDVAPLAAKLTLNIFESAGLEFTDEEKEDLDLEDELDGR